MVKAGALYFAIVVAFFIALVCAAMIMVSAYYKNTYLKQVRFERLKANLRSGIVYALSDTSYFDAPQTENMDLFGKGNDSLTLYKEPWGLFTLYAIKSFINKDTIQRAMLIGRIPDTVTLYLADEDRPLFLSGKTYLAGDVYVPKSGIRKSYADGKPFYREKLLDAGTIKYSGKKLKGVDSVLIQNVYSGLNIGKGIVGLPQKNIKSSFLDSSLRYQFKTKLKLNDVDLKGHIIIYSDSAVYIGSDAKIEGIQVYAPSIQIEQGFKGNGQFFASDSIIIGKNAILTYPSVAAVFRTDKSGIQPKIVLGNNAVFEGLLMSYEKKKSALQTNITFEKDAKLKGELFCTGVVKLTQGVILNGKISCNSILMQTQSNLYENYLIDVTLNTMARSSYYVGTRLFGSRNQEKKVVKWLN
jgi:cytoskeletal protein CcmA (bactofilin family)